MNFKSNLNKAGEDTMNGSDKWVGFFAILCLLLLTGIVSYFMFFSGTVEWKNPLSSLIPHDIGRSKEDKLFTKIKISYELSEYEQCQKLITDFLSEYPESPARNKVYLYAAGIFYDRKDFGSVKKYCTRVLSDRKADNSDATSAVFLLGRVAREAEIADPVTLNYLENAYLTADPAGKPEIANLLGYQFLFKKDNLNAMKYFNLSIGEDAVIGRARVYIETGKYPEAIQEYQNYFPSAVQSDRFERVKTAFLKQTLYYAGKLTEAKRFSDAVRYYILIVNTFPSDESSDTALLKAAAVYAENRNYQTSLDFLEKTLKNTPKNGDEEALYDKGVIQYSMNRKAEAYQTFQSYLEKYPAGPYIRKTQEWLDIVTKELQG